MGKVYKTAQRSKQRYQIILISIILFHYLVVILCLAAPFIALYINYQALFTLSMFNILWKCNLPYICPLSRLEMYYERKLGLREQPKFIRAWVFIKYARHNWYNMLYLK